MVYGFLLLYYEILNRRRVSMKKLCIVLIVLMALLVGCTPKRKNSTNTSGTNPSSDIIELDLWHIWPDDTVGDGKIVKDFVTLYEAENPQVKINVSASEVDGYKEKLKVIFSGNDIPDVYFTYGAGYSKPFVESGKVLKLDEYIDKSIRDRMIGGIEENFIYNEGLYGLPVKMWTGVLYVNRELFAQENLKYPETFDELLDVIDAFRSVGYQPMCVGGKDGWHPAMYHDILQVREAGIDGINQAMSGEKPFNAPEFLEGASKFSMLVAHDAFNDGFIAQRAQEAQAEFLMGKIPMYFNGSWLTGDIQSDDNQVKDKIDVIAFPATNKNGNTEFTGGAIDGYSVSASTPYKEEAVKLLVALSEYQSVEGYKIGDGMSTWKSDVVVSDLNPVLIQIAKLMETATGFTLAWDTRLSGADIDTFLSAVQSLQSGKITPQEYVNLLDENLEIAQ